VFTIWLLERDISKWVVVFGIDVNKSLFGGNFVTKECIDNFGLLNLLMEAEELVLSFERYL
jgi:hypothetical protein